MNAFHKKTKTIGAVIVSISILQATGEAQARWNPLKCRSICTKESCKNETTRQDCMDNCNPSFIPSCTTGMNRAERKEVGKKAKEAEKAQKQEQLSGCKSVLTVNDVNTLMKAKLNEKALMKDGYQYAKTGANFQPKNAPTKITAAKIISGSKQKGSKWECSYALEGDLKQPGSAIYVEVTKEK